MALLSNLGEACDAVTLKLEDEIAEREGQTPEVLRDPATDPDTQVGAFLETPSAKSNSKTLRVNSARNLTHPNG